MESKERIKNTNFIKIMGKNIIIFTVFLSVLVGCKPEKTSNNVVAETDKKKET